MIYRVYGFLSLGVVVGILGFVLEFEVYIEPTGLENGR